MVECWQTGECIADLGKDPFGYIMQPFFSVLGQEITFLILWALPIGIIWLRTQNMSLVGTLGMVIASSILAGLDLRSEEMQKAGLVAGSLLAVSVGVMLYQLFVFAFKRSRS